MQNEIAPVVAATMEALPSMVDRAAATLAGARTAAEVLDAREMATLAYDAAKRSARLARAKGAHDELLSKVHRAQADALDIEAQAKRILADEYDAAQERGEVATKARGGANIPDGVPEKNTVATTADLGISRRDIHEARLVRDAENADPGIVRRTVDETIGEGKEPTRARVRRAVLRIVKPDASSDKPQRGKAAICHRAREAISALSGLPPAAEVVGFLRGTDEAVIVTDHLPSAARWLAEFSDLWGDDNA